MTLRLADLQERPMTMPDLSRIEAAVRGMLDQESAELVDVRYVQEGGRWILRFFLDKVNGMTLDDCEYFSNRIGGLLDMTDLLPHAYVLEVSSPGMDRILKHERDFLRFMGHRVKLRLKNPIEGRRNFTGYLKTLDAGHVVLEAGGQTLRVALSDIDEARLNPEIEI